MSTNAPLFSWSVCCSPSWLSTLDFSQHMHGKCPGNDKIILISCLKGPCSPKGLCMLVLLFWNGSFVEGSVLISCYFPSNNFQLCKIPTMYSG